MLEVEEMGEDEINRVLERVGYGHLGCARENRPYVLPIHYTYEAPYIYIYTTEGMKTEFIAANPEVCLQVEEVHDPSHWRSVVANGKAELLTSPEDIDHAMKAVTERNPTLSPAISTMWVDVWGRANVPVIYRIRPSTSSGRKTV